MMTTAIPADFLALATVSTFILGVIIGSFLNVYIYRFHTGKSLAGSSHCLSCGQRLRWFELFPLLSYVMIRGKCLRCRAYVPVRYFVVELLTGVLFTAALAVTTYYVELLIVWTVLAIMVVVFMYDFYHYIIPDELTAAATVGVGVMLAYQYFTGAISLDVVIGTVVAACIGAAFFLLLWTVSKGAWLGFGDVKLAVPLGLLVGASNVFSFIVLSFWIGAVVSLLIIAWQKWQRGKSHLRLLSPGITMKSAVPFAPFLIASALITFFTNSNVLNLFQFFM